VSKIQLRQILLKLTGRFIFLINFCLFIAILSTALAIFLLVDYFKNAGPLTAPVNVIIAEGTPLRDISKQLAQSGVITHPDLFTFIMRGSESEKNMKAGEYAFVPGISPFQVYHKIVSGDVVVHRVTIPEGLMTSQIIDMVARIPVLTGEMPAIKEGQLLPETYDYLYGETKEKLIRRMSEAMNNALREAWEKRAADLPYNTPEEALVMASIIEKETGIESERKRIAAVFVNRLRKKMRLQTDPSVIYAVTEGKYVLGRPLLLTDLQMDSPYNTYKIEGLPPTPIANPGKASIEAALNPLQTDELYFVADGTGGHKFASTLKEHNKNVQEWRKINGAKKE
jgi:UPF0755 protein